MMQNMLNSGKLKLKTNPMARVLKKS